MLNEDLLNKLSVGRIWEDFPNKVSPELGPKAGVDISHVRGVGAAQTVQGHVTARRTGRIVNSVKTGDECGCSGIEAIS